MVLVSWDILRHQPKLSFIDSDDCLAEIIMIRITPVSKELSPLEISLFLLSCLC